MAFFRDGFSELRKVKSALECVLRPISSDIVAILLNSPRNERNPLSGGAVQKKKELFLVRCRFRLYLFSQKRFGLVGVLLVLVQDQGDCPAFEARE